MVTIVFNIKKLRKKTQITKKHYICRSKERLSLLKAFENVKNLSLRFFLLLNYNFFNVVYYGQKL